MNIYDSVAKELKKLNMQISKVQFDLQNNPYREISISQYYSKGKEYSKWQIKDAKSNRWKNLPNSQEHIKIQHANRIYLESLLEDLQSKKTACEIFLNTYSTDNKNAEIILSDPFFQPILASLFENNDPFIQAWLNEPYSSSAGHLESLVYKTMDGHSVRSKSEMIIADGLFRHKIPYRYEQDHFVNYHCHCPEFTILHPIEYEEYFWEHFGLLDDEDYSSKMGRTIADYAAEGFLPMKRLITTFENKAYPLSSADVDEIINRFFS